MENSSANTATNISSNVAYSMPVQNNADVKEQAPQNVNMIMPDNSANPAEVDETVASIAQEGEEEAGEVNQENKPFNVSMDQSPATYWQKYAAGLSKVPLYTQNENGDEYNLTDIAKSSQDKVTYAFTREFQNRQYRKSLQKEAQKLFETLDNDSNRYTYAHNPFIGNMRYNRETFTNELIDENGNTIEVAMANNFPDNSWQFAKLRG